jgi:hypothetical protein
MQIDDDALPVRIAEGLAIAAVSICLLVGCGSSRSKPIVVSTFGSIGTLRLDTSSAHAIRVAIGRPDAVRTGSEFGSGRYRALGYDCTSRKRNARWPLLERGPYCLTVFFVNDRTGKLGSFYTASRRYVEAHGVRIGITTAAAERLLHRVVHVGCEQNLYFSSRRADLTIAFDGGMMIKPSLRLRGGHVRAFALHSHLNDVGVFDCL